MQGGVSLFRLQRARLSAPAGSASEERAGLYEDRQPLLGFPSQRCQYVLSPPGSCTRVFALFPMSSPYGAPLSCLRMRWKVSFKLFFSCLRVAQDSLWHRQLSMISCLNVLWNPTNHHDCCRVPLQRFLGKKRLFGQHPLHPQVLHQSG